jgi:hypothetical protein
MTWAQRWDHMLKHRKCVDLLCWEDRRIFTFDQWLRPGAPEQILARLNSGDLKLRILLSTIDNPALDLVNNWIGIAGYMQGHVNEADDFLRRAGISTRFPILRRHRELLAFTLMRGDNELYIMYFVPQRGPGPIIQVAPLPPRDDAHLGGAQTQQGKGLFETYNTYFEDLWNTYDPGKQAGEL